MKRRLSIEELRVGMFIDAEVRSLLAEGEIRHYLEVRNTTGTPANVKRLRLARRKQEEVARDGGMLLTGWKHVAALRQGGVTEVIIDLEKSAVIPDRLFARAARPGASRPAPPSPAATLEPATDPAAADDGAFDMLILPGPPADPPGPPPPPAAGRSRRQSFGRSGAGWLKVEAPPGGAQAFLQVLSFGGDRSLGEQDLLQALEQLYGIKAGIDRGLVGSLAAQAAAFPSRVIRGWFPIAHRPEPDPSQLRGIEVTFLKDLPEAIGLPFAGLGRILTSVSLSEVLEAGLRGRVVLPGEQLAVRNTAGDRPVAQDLFGVTTGAEGASLRAGANVQLVDGRYLSEIYGYACLVERELSVVPPLWISPDCMEAYYIHLPQVGPGAVPTWSWLAEILERRGIRFGLCEAEIEALLRSPPAGTQAAAFLVARGTPPRSGGEERTTFHFGGAEQVAPPLPDLEMALRSRYRLAAVSVGQLVAELRPAVAQYPGIDLRGNSLPVPEAEAQGLRAGSNVREEQGDEIRYFHAAADGYAKVVQGEIRVQPVVYVDQDVAGELDLSHTEQDVYIRGAVRAGGIVRAKGSVVVEGIVEEGAAVYAAEDVVVAKGISGRETRVVAMGDVQTLFVQQGSVTARGDILVTDHLMNAQLRAGGRLKVGGEGRGSIAGGQAWAAVAIEASQVGSAGLAEDALLGIRPSPEGVARLRKLDQGIEFCRTNILRIFRTLGMNEVDPVHLKELIALSPPARRQALLQVLGQLKQLVATREKSLALKQALEKEQARMIAAAEIRVSGSASAGVQVHLGNAAFRLDKELHRPTFTLGAGGVCWRGAD